MNKEEILQKSRNENQRGDEREEKIKLRSYATSAAIGILICIAYVIVEELVFDRNASPLWGVYSGMMFTKYILDAIKLKKRFDIGLSIIWGLCFALNIVNYILKNIG